MTRQEPRPQPAGTDPESLAAVLRVELPVHMELSRTGGYIWDFASDRIHLDPGALAVFDLEPDEFDGSAAMVRERVLMGDAPDLQMVARTGVNVFSAYFRTRCRDGTVRWAHTHASIQRDGDGLAVRAVGMLRDAEPELADAAQRIVLGSARSDRTDVVQSVTAGLSRVLTVEDLLDFLTSQQFLDLFGACGMVLSVLEHGRRRMLATAGLPADLQHDLGVARVDSPLPIPEAIRDQKAMFVTREDVRQKYPLLWPYIEPTDLTATAILPLAAEGKPTGALALLWREEYLYTEADRNLLFVLSASVAQSLRRALLYDQEHAMSVALQQAMLPSRIPRVDGMEVAVRYQPTRGGQQVGGDWYDVIPLPDGTIMLAVGDVQGHDVRAAAVMGQLRSALRAYATEGHPPQQVMMQASRYLQELETDLIATCVCVRLDPATGRGQVVRAGHPQPMVLRSGRTGASLDTAGGLPLGMTQFTDEPYPVTAVAMAAGDTLLLCTDGLLEAHGLDLDVGEREILALLEEGPDDIEELADHIVTTVGQRQGQADDIALLLTTFTGYRPPGRF